MPEVLEPIVRFFADSFPTPEEWGVWALPSLVYAGLALYLAGSAKRRWNWATGYTRKLFHFCIFFAAAILQASGGVGALCVFGSATSCVVLFALVRGEGSLPYEAIAREKDAPRRTYYVVVPYLATLIGGVLCNGYFGSAAVGGYLVVGIADAVAEPIGVRFGRHTYRAPTLTGVVAHRSIEGSLAVGVASAIALALTVTLGVGAAAAGASALSVLASHSLALVAIALACTLVEAVSPHGWDNLTLQLTASGGLMLVLGA